MMLALILLGAFLLVCAAMLLDFTRLIRREDES